MHRSSLSARWACLLVLASSVLHGCTAADTCSVMVGCDYSKGTREHASALNQGECCSLCAARPGCAAGVFGDGVCWFKTTRDLKHGCHKASANASIVAHVKPGKPPPPPPAPPKPPPPPPAPVHPVPPPPPRPSVPPLTPPACPAGAKPVNLLCLCLCLSLSVSRSLSPSISRCRSTGKGVHNDGTVKYVG